KFFKLTNNQDLEAFLTHIESQSDLFTICHIPIQLQILCSLWTQGEREFPKSITAIVSKIIYHLFDWEKKDEKYETMSDYKKSLLYDALGEIALKGLENRELIISESLIVSVLEDKKYRKLELKSEDLIRSGLIKGCGKNGEMYFIHLIYQEYCIAKATSKLAEDKRCEFVQKYRYKPHFHLVMRMLTGCIWERSEKNLSELETFFGSFYRKPIDLIGTYQTTLVLSCLNECKNEKLEEAIWEKYKIEKCINSVLRLDAFKNFIWEIMPISIKAFNRILNYFLSSSSSGEIEFFVCMLSKFFRKDYLCEDLWQLIHKVDIKKNQSTFFNVNFGIGIKIIASIGRIEVEEKVLEIAQNIIPTCENLSVKQNVVAALGLIGGKDSLNWLKEKFYSGDPNMRLLVAQAFEGIGNLVVEKTPDLLLQWLEGSIQDKDGAEFLKWIEEGFEDSNPALSGIAATAIEKVVCNLGEKDFGRLFSSIEKGFESEKLLVRKIVAQSIKSISESKENLNQARLLDFILQICRDPTLMQRDVILNVLEKILDKVDKTKIIGWMQEELSNNGFQECELFFEILEEISCNIPEQMIVSILDILIKKSRVNAAKKIIKTSKKESNLKVLNWLVQNLSSSNSSPLSLLVTVLEEFSWQVPKEIASEMLKLSKEKLLRFFEVDQHVQSMVKEVIESNESKLDWLKQQIKDSNFAVFKSIGDSLERVSDDKSQQNSQIISLLFKENQKLCGFYEVDDIVTIFRKLIEKSQGVDRDNVLKLLEELFLDNNFQSLWVAAKFFEKIPFKINEEKFQKFLEAGLSHKDYNLQVETLNLIEAIADHLEERNRVKILTLLDKILSINKSEVGKHFFSFVIEVFGIVAEKIREGELKKENILNILSWLKINIFSAECFYIKGFARALRAASCYLVKEEIEEILKELRKGIQDKEETRMKIFTLS
ncbi:MAG: hypothetical protein ACXVAJ_07335, partial [Parachlamydiaceae bacterium]